MTPKFVRVFCYLQVSLFCFSVVVYSSPTDRSTSCPLTSDQEWLAAVNTRHDITIDAQKVICNTNSSCEIPQNSPSATSIPQLKPIKISLHDAIVPILLHQHLNTSIFLQEVHDEDSFQSCNISQSSISLELENTTEIHVNKSGIKYFIISNPITWCESGLRFKVIIRDEDCRSKDNEDFCSKRGNCVANPTDEMYSCKCCPQFIGRYCQERDGCHSNPCQNSGLCVDITEGLLGDTFQCLCPFGYKGEVCQESFDPCDSSPCLNNGTCKTRGSSYECICPPHYSGTSCQNEPDPCLSNPCVHGICRSTHQHYQCYCYPGFGGGNCEFEYDECDSNPCINGGICEDSIAGYSCHCPPGFRGNHCQIHGDLCESDPCSESQICISRGDHFTCSCADGFTGNNCEIKYDPCEPSPCENGGSCWLKYGSFYCACKPGFAGQKCEDRKFIKEITGDMVAKVAALKSNDEMISSGHVRMSGIHNIYIATGTLLAAVVVVLSVVTICHCIYKKPYHRFANTTLPRVSSSTSLFQKCKTKKKLSSKSPTIDSIYDRKSREYCVETLDIPLISSMKNDDRI